MTCDGDRPAGDREAHWSTGALRNGDGRIPLGSVEHEHDDARPCAKHAARVPRAQVAAVQRPEVAAPEEVAEMVGRGDRAEHIGGKNEKRWSHTASMESGAVARSREVGYGELITERGGWALSKPT